MGRRTIKRNPYAKEALEEEKRRKNGEEEEEKAKKAAEEKLSAREQRAAQRQLRREEMKEELQAATLQKLMDGSKDLNKKKTKSPKKSQIRKKRELCEQSKEPRQG